MADRAPYPHETMSLPEWLRQQALDRAGKYPDFAVLDRFPVFSALPGYTYLGSFSWSAPAYGWRRIVTHAALVESWSVIPQTPTEITRDYLRYKYPRRLRATSEQARAITTKRLPPAYAEPGEYPDMVYVDLRSAYWSIVRMVGWDVDYFPGRWLAAKSNVEDYPLANNKPARASLVSAGISTHTRVWTGSRLEWKASPKMGINFGLWALTQDVLNGIAADILTAAPSCRYINTDGYIIEERDLPRANDVISAWGLNWAVKGQGDCTISGLGIYSIGDRKTKTYSHKPTPTYRVMPVCADWLRTRMSWLKENERNRLSRWNTDRVDRLDPIGYTGLIGNVQKRSSKE